MRNKECILDVGPASGVKFDKFDQLGYVLYTGINILGVKR